MSLFVNVFVGVGTGELEAVGVEVGTMTVEVGVLEMPENNEAHPLKINMRQHNSMTSFGR